MQMLDMNDPKTVKVLWAAMCAMVEDIHSPQDTMTLDDWAVANQIYQQLDTAMNSIADQKWNEIYGNCWVEKEQLNGIYAAC